MHELIIFVKNKKILVFLKHVKFYKSRKQRIKLKYIIYRRKTLITRYASHGYKEGKQIHKNSKQHDRIYRNK